MGALQGRHKCITPLQGLRCVGPDPTQGVALGFLRAPFQGEESRSRRETPVAGGKLKPATASVTAPFLRRTTLQALVVVMTWDVIRRFPVLCPGIMGLSKSWQRGRALKRGQPVSGIQIFSDRNFTYLDLKPRR